MTEYCICGHDIGEHVGWEGEPNGCTHTYEIAHGSTGCYCEGFQLDNLRYVEDLAKKKNLI